ncbi:glutathione S-transferase family protein [Sphingomonas sp.]|uniref:glutathione S-transferase family protein n=1 Tax=Sphingomonas sp. TaxID=28214 RepID=UPI000DB85AA7|nr:glutathione S-transferase [Sphingomonas sp.]PZU10776.1 MAG: glutathione S-transferase [Sphingomonas sp.]
MATIRLLGRKTSGNVQKILWMMSEMNLAFSREDYGGPFASLDAPAFVALNSNRLVPVLVHGDEVVWESNSILRYLANVHGPTPLYPEEPYIRSLCERWMDWQLSSLNPCMSPLFIAMVRTAAADRDPVMLERLTAQARDLFARLDEALAATDYLAGSSLTLADISTGMFAYRWFEMALDRGTPTPHLRRWLELLKQRAAFREYVMIGLS